MSTVVGMITYNDAARREDLDDFVSNIAPKSTPFYSNLPKTEASNTLHEWLVDTYAASADNAVYEGADAVVADLTQPTRRNNICQIFRKVVNVSDTERAVNVAGMKDVLAYQISKASTELARDIEEALVAGTRASGATGVARRLQGAISQITTLKTARTSGTSLSETNFNNIQANIWANTDEAADEVYVGARLKRVISGYTAGSTKNVNAADKRLISSVDVYESDFGVHKIFAHREIPAAAGSAGLMAINSKLWNLAVLRPVKSTPLAKIGSSEKVMLEGELTLVGKNEAGNSYEAGWNLG